eukprot:6918919-Ditylum_brightwellii.AAC.1
MDGYFKTTILTMFNGQMTAFCKEMSQHFELLKLQHSTMAPSLVHTGTYNQPSESTKLDMEIKVGVGTQ